MGTVNTGIHGQKKYWKDSRKDVVDLGFILINLLLFLPISLFLLFFMDWDLQFL